MSTFHLARIGALLLGIALLQSCSNVYYNRRNAKFVSRAENHVLFDHLCECLAVEPTASPKIIRLFLDSNGDIYPPVADNIAAGNPPLRLMSPHYELRAHYTASSNKATMDALARKYGTPATWSAVQQELTYQYINRLRGALAPAVGMPRRPLVVLIHGFNVPAGTHEATGTSALYTVVRDSLVAKAPSLAKAVWLEVYWDGLRNAPRHVWETGQLYARYAGLRLRPLLAGTDPTTPIRVFTHSAGGIVAAHAFWNVYAPYHDSVSTQEARDISAAVHRLYKQPTPSHCDVHLGLLVPAMPGNTFLDYSRRTIATLTAENDPAPAVCNNTLLNGRPNYRVVIGQNRKDVAVTKRRVTAGHYDATTLGCRASAYSRFVLVATEQQAQRIDFCQNRKKYAQRRRFCIDDSLLGEFLETHDWQGYLQRTEFSDFVRAVNP